MGGRDGGGAGPENEVGMIGKESPHVAGDLRDRQEPLPACEKALPILVVPEDVSALDPPDNEVMHTSRRIQACGSRHGSSVSRLGANGQLE